MNHHNKNPSRQTLLSAIGLIFILSLSACQPTDADLDATDTQTSNQTNGSDAGTGTATTPTPIATKTEFPQYINAIPALLHPITPTNIEEDDTGISSLKYRKGDGYQPIFEQEDTYHYRTYASNFVFEEITTGDIQNLMPSNAFIISQIFIPYTTQYTLVTTKDIPQDADDSDNLPENKADRATRRVTVNTPFDYVIYHVSETPNKPDKKDKNLMRQQALYMSNHKGAKLTKLHPDNEYISATKWMPQFSRYYFITQSDSDDNGLIDDKDAYHNYQIDFTADTPVVRGYTFSQ